MFEPEVRLPTHVWVDALIRRANVAGASAFVLQRGDAERGDTLVKVATLNGLARLLRPGMGTDGTRVFTDLSVQGIGPEEVEVDAYIERARSRDGDVWVIEIEDRDGRHFLTETVEGETAEPPSLFR